MEGSDSGFYRAVLDHFSSKTLLGAIESGRYGSLPFTKEYYSLAMRKDMSTESKFVEAIGILDEFADFFEKNKDKVYSTCRTLAEDGFRNAREKIRKWDTEGAATDIFYAERILIPFLKEELSKIPSSNSAEGVLRERMSETYPQFEIYRNACIAGQNFNPKVSRAYGTRAPPARGEASS